MNIKSKNKPTLTTSRWEVLETRIQWKLALIKLGECNE